MNNAVKRVQLDLPEKAWARLQQLKERTEAASLAEVIKNSLRLYEAFYEEEEAGNSFMVKTPSGELKQILVF